MNDLINRQAAIDAVLSVIPYDDYWKEQIEKVVNKLPSAQPEIIRCEECVYRNNTGASVRWLPCMEVPTGDYWFCGSGKRAERREE